MKKRRFIALLTALTMVLAVVPYVGAIAEEIDLEDGLIVSYDFNSDSASPTVIQNAIDSKYNASVVNTVTQSERPWEPDVNNVLTIEGGAAKFPGYTKTQMWGWDQANTGAAIKIPYAVKNEIDEDYTVSMWIKQDTQNNEYSGKPTRFFDFGLGLRDSIYLRYTPSSGELRFQDRGQEGASADGESCLISTTVDLGEVWNLITVSYVKSTKTAKVYLNGKEIMQGSVFKRTLGDLGDLTDETYGFYLGRTQWYNDNSERANNPDFKGYMDDVRIYNRAINASEVAALYSETMHNSSLKMIASGNVVSVKTTVGTAPSLPESLDVTFTDNSTGKIYVDWDSIDSASYADEGKFTVNGTAYSTSEKSSELSYGKIAKANVSVVSEDDSLETGLLAHYSFDQDAATPTTINDDSGNANHATAYDNGQSRDDRTRKITVENSIANFPGRFDSRRGGAYIKLPEKIRTGLGDYTVSMWVKADSTYRYADKLQRIFDFGVGDYDSIFLRYVPSTGDLRFQDRALGSSGDDSASFISTTTTALTDAWALVTVTYNAESNTAIVYVNGKEVMSGDKFTRSIGDMDALTNDNYGMFIGRTVWNNADNPDFCGKMDDIRIYNRAITAEEVARLYTTTPPEKLTQISISIELDDGTIIDTKTESVGENSKYSYDAPATVEYNGTIYSLSKRLSSLEISSVNDKNNTITAVYVVKKMESAKKYTADVYKGTIPQLPEKIRVEYNTGDTENVSVKWDDITEDMFKTAAVVTIKGKTASDSYENIEATAEITVYEITDVEKIDTIYTNVAQLPTLPETVSVSFSNSAEAATCNIKWDTVLSAEDITNGRNITVRGHLVEYPDVEIEATVVVVLLYTQEYTAIADTYSHDGEAEKAHGSEDVIKITSTSNLAGYYSSGAGYNRYGFFKFNKPAQENPSQILLKLFVDYIDNGAPTTFTLVSASNDWTEETLTWNNQGTFTADSQTIDTQTLSASAADEYLVFDVTEYVKNCTDDEISFCVMANTCATYIYSREKGSNPPVLECLYPGRDVNVVYSCDGKALKTKTAVLPQQDTTYIEEDSVILADGVAYEVVDSSVAVGKDETTVTVNVSKIAKYDVDTITVNAYVGETVSFPAKATVRVSDIVMKIAVDFGRVYYDEAGIYTCVGTADGESVEATVKAYEPYVTAAGATTGYGVVVNNVFVNSDGKKIADPIKTIIPLGQAYSADDELLKYYPQVANAQGEQSVTYINPTAEYKIVGERVDGVSGTVGARLTKNNDIYKLNVTAYAANTAKDGSSARIVVVKYADGKVSEFKTEPIELSADMYNRKMGEISVDYDRTADDDIRVYLWDGTTIRPLSEAIVAASLPEPEKYSDEIKALIPEYETVTENVKRANNYWQSNIAYNSWQNGIHPAFWDTAAYETGNMEAYFTLGDASYKQYAENWAESNSWQGNTYSGNKENWTYGYNQNQGSDAVLFGDWQICFQSYLDLNLLEPSANKISRATEVMGYQITKDNDDFWWWADSLYMVTPVMTKMYLTTGDEEYLNALYKYYKYSAELMYDGEEGIPTSREGYTTDAYNGKKNGSYYSDADNYAHLFYRDANYVYPLNPNSGHENEKNFWARGNGWVFAGLAKILNDIPTDFEHYSFFSTIYRQMAKAIIECQKLDSSGRGFWTQSMLQNYPVGNNNNNEGYETSGTAFLTYGLFWGINSGMLDEETYLEPALRAWKYLSEEALHDNGKVGYVQPIGSNATQATAKSTTQPFGVGAFLLAGCEVSRWVGGVSEENAPYLMRKMWHGIGINADKYYVDGNVLQGTASYTDSDGTLYVPLIETAEMLEVTVEKAETGYNISDISRGAFVQDSVLVQKDSTVYIPAQTLARAIGRHVSVYGDVTVINHKSNVFFDCDAAAVEYLNALLAK